MNSWSRNAESAKNTLSQDKLEIIQRVWLGKYVAALCFRQAGVVISPFICFNALGKS